MGPRSIIFLITFFMLFFFSSGSATAFHNGVVDITPPELPAFSVAALVSLIIKILIIAGFTLAFLFLMIGGIRWITSSGDPKGVEGAKGMVTAAVIGLILVVASFAIIRLIEYFFNISVISNSFTLPKI